MKAMELTTLNEIVLEDVARPGSHAGDVTVHISHTGICGTDYKIYNSSIPIQYPRIMGQ